MFIKKFCCSLVLLMCLVNVFIVSTSAARTGEFETYNVEFKALTPDDFTSPVEIKLTHLTENYFLKYYLYDINGYFSNELVPPGKYSVSVSVGDAEDGEFTFIFDKELIVEASSLAPSYTVIIDNASLEGDASGDIVSDTMDTFSDNEAANDTENVSDVETMDEPLPEASDEEDRLVSSQEVSEESEEDTSDEPSFLHSLMGSLVFSVIIIILGAIVLWLFFKRR